jgi:PAS domain S-box-containing protein
MYNKLLQRQLEKYITGTTAIPEGMETLLSVISDSYDHYEKERKMLERSIELSSGEMIALNNKLKADIAERKNAEKKLGEMHSELNILLENVEEVLFAVDMVNQKVTHVSAAAEKMYGYKSEEFLKNPFLWQEVIHDEDKHLSIELLAALEKGIKVNNRYRIIHKDQSIRWLENKIIPTLDANGNLVRLDGISSDITEKIRNESILKEKEIKLVENERKYRHLFENNPMPMWVVDPLSDRFLNVNASALKHYGYTKSEFLNMTTFDIRPSEEKHRFAALDMKERSGPASFGIWKHFKKDGTVIDVEISADSIEFEGKKARLILANDITEKIKAEEKLRRSNERYELATKATNDAIWDWNLENDDLYWSGGYAKLFGYEIDKESNHITSWTKRIHPEDLDRVKKGIEEKLKDSSGDFWEDEYRYFKADGTVAYIYDRGYIVYNSGRKPVRMVGAMQDITRRKKMEESIYKSEANLRNLLENTDTAYVLLDEQARVLSFNNAAKMLAAGELQKEIEEGVSYTDLLPAERRAEVTQSVDEVLASCTAKRYEVKYNRKGGEDKWLDVSMYPIFNKDKKILGLSIAAANITERKLSEQKLSKSEANLRTIFDNTYISYVMLDKQFNIISFNDCAIKGYKKELGRELTEGTNLMDYLPEERKSAVLLRYIAVLNGNKLNYESSFEQADGTLNWYEMNVFPVSDENQNVFGLIIATEDITQRKNIELEREKMTGDILQHNKDLEQFAYIISHNLRSPVANIIGLSNMLQGNFNLSEEDRKKCMQGLALSVNKLDSVIIDLNYILQVRREVNEKKEIVKFSGITRDISTSINNLIEKEDVTIKTNFRDVNEFFTIKSYLNSIFYNLIVNSIKYRHPGRKTIIEITGRRIQNKVHLSFRDNGLGMDVKANEGKIFGLYKKFHNHIEGKGMGLYMVKTQAEILGGKISVNSEVNEGTEFTIEFDASVAGPLSASRVC